MSTEQLINRPKDLSYALDTDVFAANIFFLFRYVNQTIRKYWGC